jgi:hypothetical protein
MGQQTPNTVVDGFGPFPQGMNAGVPAQALPKDQAAMLTNGTLRGTFATTRPKRQKITLDYTGDFDGTGRFQDACYYMPDAGAQSIVAAIAGKLFQFTPSTSSVACKNIGISGDDNSADVSQHWLWQTEKWVIDQDGQSVPRIFDGSSTRRSRNLTTIYGTVAVPGSIPDTGETVLLSLYAQYTGPMYSRVILFDNSVPRVNLGYFETRPDTSAVSQVILTPATNTPTSGPPGTPIQASTDSSLNYVTNYSVHYLSGSGNFYATLAFPLVQNTAGIYYDITRGWPASFATQTFVGATFSWSDRGLCPDLPEGHLISGTGTPAQFTTLLLIKNAFTATPIGVEQTVTVETPYTGPEGAMVWINGLPFYIRKVPIAASLNIALFNVTGTSGTAIPIDSIIVSIPELQIGKMGAYVQGRNWMALADGISFVASDEVGGSSGSIAFNYRDAVLCVTNNNLLAQGGSFRVPSSVGGIRFIVAMATLDASLGQGPVQVGTPTTIFSCSASIAGQDWTTVTNPILTESLIGNGGMGQNGAVVVNGDLIMRSLDGLRSLILARREFATWGNTPISNEVRALLNNDPKELLPWCSVVFFDNRLLATTGMTAGAQGVYGAKTVAMNCDPVSSLRGKAPSIYDGVWDGLNVLKYVTGIFNGVQRCFAFVSNTTTNLIELWETLPTLEIEDSATPDPTNYLDNGTDNITLSLETPVLFDELPGKEKNDLCRLTGGEMYVQDLFGDATFTVYFRPDDDSVWHLWATWTVPLAASYMPRMGFGEPPGDTDATTGRPWREGYNFQFKFVVQGHCSIMGGRMSVAVLPTPTFAPLFA